MNAAGELAFEAHRWMERGQWQRARDALRRGLEQAPDDLDLLYARARLDFLCESGSALDSAEEVLALAPEHAGAGLLRARILAEQGRHAEAERGLLDLLRASPQDSELLCHYAFLLLRAGQLAKARALASEAARSAPEDLLVLSTLALLDMAEGRTPRDMGALGKMLDLYPEAESTLRTLAFILAERMQLGAAREAAALLVRRNPNDADVVRLAAHIAYLSHWSMRPLYPILRWGWAGSFGLYGGFIALNTLGRGVLPAPLLFAVSVAWISYALYSWVYPPILKRRRFPELL